VRSQALLAGLILALAAYLRIPDLADRPMHADEAIYAYKLQTLLKTGTWTYDPGEVVMPLTLANTLSRAEAIAASALIAISPAMIYYSRYYIPEMLLTLLTAGLLTLVFRYSWGPIAGLLLGLMVATKETAVVAAACLLLARKKLPNWRHLLAASIFAMLVVVLLLGPRETVQAMSTYLQRAVQGQRHLHPWYYYLLLLLRSEFVIVALAVVGAFFSKRLALYTLAMTAVYSFIPYKTPWCLLGFLYGMILLAGVGVVFLARRKPLALGFAAICAIQLFTADAQRIYDYAGTSRDVYAMREQLEKFRNLPIQVITTQNIWPLPWYLRDFPQIEWRRAVTDDMRPAPVILATPDVEPALLHQLYEVLPPGQRPLYVDLFGKYTQLRADLELRGYIQQSALMQ
jgi:predicted membrane-bound mannosyltransferase